MNESKLLLAGIIVVFIGFALIAAGSGAQGSASTGVVIFIGPVPIVFGSGQNSGQLIMVGLLIAVVMVIMSLISMLSFRRASQMPGGASATP